MPFVDDFTGAAAKLTTRPGWVQLGSGWGPDNPETNGNGQLRTSTTATASPDAALIGYDTGGTEHYVQAKVYTGYAYAAGQDRTMLYVLATARNDGVGIAHTGGAWYLIRDNQNSLGSWVGPLADGDIVRLEVEGGTVKFFLNGTLRISSTDVFSTHLDNTHVGVKISGAPGANPVLDDFQAGLMNEADTAPAKMTGATATGGAGYVDVTGTVTSDGGSPVTSYTALLSDGKTATSATLPVRVNGAAAGVEVTARIQATNAIGTGPLSDPSNSVTPTAAPVAPTANITNVVMDGQDVTITLTTANTPTSGMATLTAVSGDAVTQGPKALSLSSGAASVVFNAVPPGTYSQTVTVSNGGGTNTASGARNITIDSIGGTPEAPGGTPPTGDTVAPTVTGATVANASPGIVALALSEAPDAAFVPAASAFTVSGHTVSSVALAGSNINLTVTPVFAFGEAERTVTYTQPGNNGVRDVAGNLLASFSGLAVTNNVAAANDTTAPTITAAAVASASPGVVVLTSSEPLATGFVPAAAAFTVTGHTVSSVALAGSAINLTVTPNFANGEAPRTVSYTQPGANGARDAAGNLIASFSGLAITNNVAAPISTVTGVTINPTTATIAGGATQAFTAAAQGTNSPAQTFTWTRSPAVGTITGNGTANGSLTAPAATNVQQTIEVTATSQQDPNFSAKAVVTVPPAAPAGTNFTRSLARTIKVKPAPQMFEGGPFWNTTNKTRPVGTIDKDETIDVSFDLTEVLADISDTVKQIDFDLAGLTSVGGYFTGAVATVFVSSAVPLAGGKNPTITCKMTTNSTPARIEDWTVELKIEEQ